MGAWGAGLTESDGAMDFIDSFISSSLKQIQKQVNRTKKRRHREDLEFFGAMHVLIPIMSVVGEHYMFEESEWGGLLDDSIELCKFYITDKEYLEDWKDSQEVKRVRQKLLRDLKKIKSNLE